MWIRTAIASALFTVAALAGDRIEKIAPVLLGDEPTDSRFVTLPGHPEEPPRELKDFTPPPPPPLPTAQLPPTPPAATMAVLRTVPTLPVLTEEARPVPRRAPKQVFPPDFERDSALYCQQRIGEWSEPDVYNLFGKALRRRSASGTDRQDAGLIFAFSDPTGKYREIELDFAAETGLLRSVFVYPWQMTWTDARRLWGTNVNAAQANKGRTFYSYVNRRLDVLVDSDGKVISLGLY